MVRLAISERRELLIEAAWSVMLKHGVAAATTRAICAEAGMPQSSFHYCFESRADLLKIVVTNRLPGHIESTRRITADSASPIETVQRALEAYWADVVQNTSRHAVLYDIALASYYDADLAELRVFQYDEYHRAARKILAFAAGEGYRWAQDEDTLAVATVAFIDGATLRYIANPNSVGLPDALMIFGRFLAGMLVPVEE